MPSAFSSSSEELEYLRHVKNELTAATTKDEVAGIWRKHYLSVGHRKLGRLLLGRTPEQAMKMRQE